MEPRVLSFFVAAIRPNLDNFALAKFLCHNDAAGADGDGDDDGDGDGDDDDDDDADCYI